MTPTLNETHHASAASWIESANRVESDFPLQNLPLGVFWTSNDASPRIGVRIGDAVVDLPKLLETGLIVLTAREEQALRRPTLNDWMALGRQPSGVLRRLLFELLHDRAVSSVRETATSCIVEAADCTMALPSAIGDFTDFFTSIHHAQRAGQAVRGTTELHPNFRTIPIAYHGRSSSIEISGVSCQRPYGILDAERGYVPSQKLDFELELGFYVGKSARSKTPISVDQAREHVFGFCLVNDWSARDIQRWESSPLGPFLGKSFMTSTSAWVVTAEALAPFHTSPPTRERDAPPLASELTSPAHVSSGALDLVLDVTLQSRAMREAGMAGVSIGSPNFKDQYWTSGQMLAHHVSNGCPLNSGDLLSSGTVSGAAREDSGCLLERTRDGKEPIVLPTGEYRGYLVDGDRVAFTGRCTREGFRTIGFGECVAEVIGG